MRTTALVAGAGGIIGNAVAHELMASSWTVRALGRRPVAGVPSIQADLTDAVATAGALRKAADTTHLFYAALAPDPDLATEAARNAAMLGNLLDGLEAASAPVQRVIIYQGFKIYGIHLGAKVQPRPVRAIHRTCRPISTRRRKPRCVLGRSAASGTMSRSDRTSWW